MFLRIRKFFKLLRFLDSVEIKALTDNTLHVKIQGNLVVHTTGDQLFCSKEGQSFQLFNTIHMNPEMDRNKLFDGIESSGVQLENTKVEVLEHANTEYAKWQEEMQSNVLKEKCECH